MEQEKQNKKERLIVIIILILIAIFIIVYLLVSYLGIIEHKPKIPTGNVDIFEIVFGKNIACGCTCHNCANPIVGCNQCGCMNNNNIGNNNGGSGGSTNNNTGEGDNKVVVYDSDTDYSTNTPLNIFKQTAYYIIEDKIAPTSENSYHFVIKNSNDFSIEYNFEAIETNLYNINMKYRLKRNGTYVVGNDKEYVTFDELKQYNIELSDRTYDVYTLDWKWFESSNDTQIGEDISSYYGLKLKVTANQK